MRANRSGYRFLLSRHNLVFDEFPSIVPYSVPHLISTIADIIIMAGSLGEVTRGPVPGQKAINFNHFECPVTMHTIYYLLLYYEGSLNTMDVFRPMCMNFH